MASMGPFPSERIGRDIDDLPVWEGWNFHPYEWNEFYCSRSDNISPFSFPKIPLSPPASPHSKKAVVEKRRSSKTKSVKRRSSNDSISGENSRNSRDGSIKSKKKKKITSSEKVTKPKSKKKKSKKTRTKSVSSQDSFDTLNSASHDSSTEFSSSSFRSSIPTELSAESFMSPRSSADMLSSSFRSPLSASNRSNKSASGLSKSMRSLNTSCSSIMGCDLPEDVIDYIEELEHTRPQSEPQLKVFLEAGDEIPPKKVKKKKKKKTKKDEKKVKSPRKEKVTEKKLSPVRTSKAKAAPITMETLPEEVLVSTKTSQSGRRRGLGRSLSPKRTPRFSKLMVVADGSLRRVVDGNKGSFWEQSIKRRGSVRQSIHSALGEIAGIEESLDLFDEDDAKLDLELTKTAERSVSTEITDPWHNSWSMSSDSFHDNSDRAFRNPLLLSKSPELENHKKVTPY